MSGGEPTLRVDLARIVEVLCKSLPNLIGTGIITNGIVLESSRDRILAASEVCKRYRVDFNVMVSLDGVGEVHDTVRGKPNNFLSAMALIRYFKDETKIPVSFGCTITQTNAKFVDELLDFAISEGLYGRFRIAEYITRLYNDDSTCIRSFSSIEKYHLALFFHRLLSFEKGLAYLNTY